MALIFAVLCVALAAMVRGPRRLALAAAALCLLLAAGLFLFEVHSPEDGFRMPWLEVRGGSAGRVHRTARIVHRVGGAGRCTASLLVARPIRTGESSVWAGQPGVAT